MHCHRNPKQERLDDNIEIKIRFCFFFFKKMWLTANTSNIRDCFLLHLTVFFHECFPYSKMKAKVLKIHPLVFCFFWLWFFGKWLCSVCFCAITTHLESTFLFWFKVAILSLEKVLIYIVQYKHLSAIVDQNVR